MSSLDAEVRLVEMLRLFSFLDPDIHGEAKHDSAEEHQNTKLTNQSITRSRVQKKFARRCWRRVERSSWCLGKDSMLMLPHIVAWLAVQDGKT